MDSDDQRGPCAERTLKRPSQGLLCFWIVKGTVPQATRLVTSMRGREARPARSSSRRVSRPWRIPESSHASPSPQTARYCRRIHARLASRNRRAGPPRRQQIRDEVATSHLWLAETLARQFLHRGEDEEDLLQVACTGLVEACRRLTRTKVLDLRHPLPPQARDANRAKATARNRFRETLRRGAGQA